MVVQEAVSAVQLPQATTAVVVQQATAAVAAAAAKVQWEVTPRQHQEEMEVMARHPPFQAHHWRMELAAAVVL